MREDYVRYFDRFLAGPGAAFSPTRFGYGAVGEPSFMKHLREGHRQIRLSTIERAILFCQTYMKTEAKKQKADGNDEEHSGA